MGDASKLNKAFGDASSSAGKFGSAVAKVGKAIAIGFVVGVAAAAVAITKFVQAALEAEKSQARLDAAFKHAGASAAEQAKAMKAVNDISVKSGLDDEALADSLSRLIQVTGDSAKATTDMGIAADIARGRGIELEAATNIVTKAALGNVGALKRIGIEIPKVTAAQDALKAAHGKATAEQIKAAKAADDLATRQGALASLQKKYAGDAEAYGKTASGAMDRFKVAIENVEEGLGKALLPALARVAGGVADFLDKFNKAEGASEKFAVVLAEVKTLASQAWEALKAAFNAIDWGAVWETVTSKIASGVTTLYTATKAAIDGVDWEGTIKTAGDRMGAALVAALNKLASWVNRANWGAVGQAMVVGFEKAVGAAILFLANVDWVGVVSKMVNLYIAAWKAYLTLLVSVGKTVGEQVINGILKGLSAAWGAVASWIGAVPGKIKNLFSGAVGWLASAGSSILAGLWNGAKAGWDKGWNWFAQIPGTIKNFFASAGSWLFNAGLSVLTGLWNGLKQKWTSVAEWLGGLGTKIASLKGPESKDATLLVPHGQAIITGLGTGMKTAFVAVAADASKMGADLVGSVSGGIKLASSGANEVAASFVATIKTTLGDFKGVGDTWAAALSAAAEKAISAAAAKVEAAKGKFTAAFGSLASGITGAFSTISGAVKTPAEKALAQLDKTTAEAARQQALTDATIAMQTATSEAEKQAAQTQYDAAMLAIKRAGLEEQAAQERIQLDAQNAVRAEALQTALTQLQTQLENGRISYATWNAKVMQLLSSYIPGWKTKGDLLGDAVVRGLKSKIALAQAAAQNLAEAHKVMAEYVDDFTTKGKNLGEAFAKGLRSKLSEVQSAANALAKAATINAKVTVTASTGSVDGARAAGGPVTKNKTYLVGENGPEMFVPRMSGAIIPNTGAASLAAAGGVTNNYFSFPQFVGNQRDLVQTVLTELNRHAGRNS